MTARQARQAWQVEAVQYLGYKGTCNRAHTLASTNHPSVLWLAVLQLLCLRTYIIHFLWCTR